MRALSDIPCHLPAARTHCGEYQAISLSACLQHGYSLGYRDLVVFGPYLAEAARGRCGPNGDIFLSGMLQALRALLPFSLAFPTSFTLGMQLEYPPEIVLMCGEVISCQLTHSGKNCTTRSSQHAIATLPMMAIAVGIVFGELANWRSGEWVWTVRRRLPAGWFAGSRVCGHTGSRIPQGYQYQFSHRFDRIGWH
jgi:hypothetical protein